MADRRCVFIDFDGTFADQGVAPLEHAEAVARARANGHLILLSTGRPASIVAPEVAALFDGVISSAGGHVRVGDEVLHDERFPAALGRRAAEVLERHDVAFALEAPEALWCSSSASRRIRARMADPAPHAAAGIGNGPRDIVDAVRVPEDLGACSFAKISLWESRVPVEQLAAEIGPEIGALPNSITSEDTSSGELHLLTVDKADGLRRTVEHLGLDLAATVAIGDGLNDLGMLRAAGTGISIAGARDEVRDAALFEVPGPSEHGIVTAFERLGLL
ncbi:HAD hydrolase family protein [Brachybacterium sp. 107]|uniref:HAD hydrolase family protein n=1 Tax=Brachybacterium sp. 107 TaxID=3457736 RepID=UPI0040334B4D